MGSRRGAGTHRRTRDGLLYQETAGGKAVRLLEWRQQDSRGPITGQSEHKKGSICKELK